MNLLQLKFKRYYLTAMMNFVDLNPPSQILNRGIITQDAFSTSLSSVKESAGITEVRDANINPEIVYAGLRLLRDGTKN